MWLEMQSFSVSYVFCYGNGVVIVSRLAMVLNLYGCVKFELLSEDRCNVLYKLQRISFGLFL